MNIWRPWRLNPHPHRGVGLFGKGDYHWPNTHVARVLVIGWWVMIIFYFYLRIFFFALPCIGNWFMSYDYFLFLTLNIFFCLLNIFFPLDYDYFFFCPLIKILFYKYNFFFLCICINFFFPFWLPWDGGLP